MSRWGPPLAVLAVAAVLPAFAGTAYTQTLLNLAVIYALNVLGMHVIFGLTGILSIAQAAFWGLGAYASAILTTDYGLPFWMGFLAALTVAAVAGIVLGVPTLRLKTHYLVLATIAFAEVTRQVLNNWDAVTHGPQGLPGVPKAALFGYVFATKVQQYYLGLAVLTLAVLVVLSLRASRLGRAMEAVRDDALAARAMGINVTGIQILAFSTSAVLGGAAGSLYAHIQQFVSPETFDLHVAVLFLAMLMIGGRRSVAGAMVGAGLLTYMPEWLRALKDWNMVIFGGGLLLILIFAPDGLAGTAGALWQRLRRRTAWQREVVG